MTTIEKIPVDDNDDIISKYKEIAKEINESLAKHGWEVRLMRDIVNPHTFEYVPFAKITGPEYNPDENQDQKDQAGQKN